MLVWTRSPCLICPRVEKLLGVQIENILIMFCSRTMDVVHELCVSLMSDIVSVVNADQRPRDV